MIQTIPTNTGGVEVIYSSDPVSNINAGTDLFSTNYWRSGAYSGWWWWCFFLLQQKTPMPIQQPQQQTRRGTTIAAINAGVTVVKHWTWRRVLSIISQLYDDVLAQVSWLEQICWHGLHGQEEHVETHVFQSFWSIFVDVSTLVDLMRAFEVVKPRTCVPNKEQNKMTTMIFIFEFW
jgi:hypothetical protein